jgi:cytochrome P450
MPHLPPQAPPPEPGGTELEHLLEAARHGDPLVRLADGSWLAHHPDAVRHVLQRGHRNYALRTPEQPLMGRRSLAMSHDDAWRQRRRLLQPHLGSARPATLGRHVVAAVDRRLDELRDTGGAVDIEPHMVALALDTLLAALFGDGLQDDGVATQIHRAFDCFNARARGATLDEATLRKALGTLEDFLRTLIAERRGGPDRDDLLAALLTARDPQSGAALGDDDLLDELMMLLVMGHMSTAMGLTWTCHLLARHPATAARLALEVGTVLDGRPPEAGDLDRLPWLRQVFDEALRLYPPGWAFARYALEDDTFEGFTIPAGTAITLSPWVTQRRADLWPEPERFDPGRFDPGPAGDRHPFAYFPFGAGPRNCVGSTLARVESLLTLARIAQRFRLEPAGDEPVELEPNIALMPRDGLHLVLHRRGD